MTEGGNIEWMDCVVVGLETHGIIDGFMAVC